MKLENNTEYEIVFSYNTKQTNKKVESYIKRLIEKNKKENESFDFVLKDIKKDEEFVDVHCTSSENVNKINKFTKTILAELEKDNTKLSVSCNEIEYVTYVMKSQVSDMVNFNSMLENWCSEKKIETLDIGDNFIVKCRNQKMKNLFIENLLPQLALFTNNYQTPHIHTEKNYTPLETLNENNYEKKKTLSM